MLPPEAIVTSRQQASVRDRVWSMVYVSQRLCCRPRPVLQSKAMQMSGLPPETMVMSNHCAELPLPLTCAEWESWQGVEREGGLIILTS